MAILPPKRSAAAVEGKSVVLCSAMNETTCANVRGQKVTLKRVVVREIQHSVSSFACEVYLGKPEMEEVPVKVFIRVSCVTEEVHTTLAGCHVLISPSVARWALDR